MTSELRQEIEGAQKDRGSVESDRALRKAKAEAADWKRKYEDALEHMGHTEELAELMDSLNPRRAAESWEREKGHTPKGKATAIVVLSDWHVGETVQPGAVDGKNEFNPEVAERRIKKLFSKIPEYIERYVPMAKTVVLAALGDFITGHIHEELCESNSMSPMEECRFFEDHFNAGLNFLLKHTKQEYLIPTAVGNHARTTPKMRISTSHDNSFEQFTYLFMEKQWRNEPRVHWKIGTGYHNWVTLHGRDVRFHHGEAVRFQGGIGGLTIPMVKAIRGWNTARQAALDCLGHHHQLFEGHRFVCNGSLIGYGAYSLKIKAEFEEPMQAFIVVDEKKWFRQLTRIYLDE